ncbi:UTP--glucose-1-phosphate uridylyltransferase [Candidatus Entotheonellaceae bacterium PAL068K]
MIKQAVILAGGFGTRLGTLTRDIPKPLLPVGDKVFLDYLVWNLRRHGFQNIVMSVGYQAEKIQMALGDGRRYGIEIVYVVEEELLGTGGALCLCAEQLDQAFIVLNGDTFFDFNYLDLALMLADPGVLAAMALRPVDDASHYGRVQHAAGRVTQFEEKGARVAGLINGGVYAMKKAALAFLPARVSSIERDLFPQLLGDQHLACRAYDGFFIDIGVIETYQEAQTRVPAIMNRPACFLDRDGVINVNHGYVATPARFEWMPEAPEAIKWLNDKGYLVIAVTNQSGIGRGYYTENDFLKFSVWIQEALRDKGAHLDAVYYCPHHPTAGQGEYQQECEARKPGPGMFIKALREWSIQKEKSVCIGDKLTDLAAANRVGIRGRLYSGGSLLEFVKYG